MRRLAITLLIVPLAGLAGLSLLSSPALAGTSEDGGAAADLAPVDVLQVSGLFDDVTVQSVEDAIDEATERGSQALILQLNTGGSIVDDAAMQHLLQKVADAKIAIGVWVGPSRDARAYGTPAQLFGVADVTAMVAGSRIGHTGELLTLDGVKVDLGRFGDELRNDSMSFGDARSKGVLRLDSAATTYEYVTYLGGNFTDIPAAMTPGATTPSAQTPAMQARNHVATSER